MSGEKNNRLTRQPHNTREDVVRGKTIITHTRELPYKFWFSILI